MNKINFEIQRFARDPQDTLYRGRHRWSGNWGRLWINDALIFEISKFEAKITTDRDDVIIGQSKDSKIVSLTGEGSFTIKKVFDRGYSNLLEEWKAGHDIRSTFVGAISDPDTIKNQKTRVVFDNVWINELPVMNFEKGTVVEDEITFGFTPEDVSYLETVQE